jgi:sodium transport system permease protein
MTRIATLALKEFRELVRDPRTLFSSMTFALVGPFVLVAVVAGIAASNAPVPAGALEWCAGSATAPQLAAYLRNEGYRFAPNAPVCLAVPSDLSQRLASSRTAEVEVRADLLEHDAQAQRVASDVEAFAAAIGDARLIARGVAPPAARPLRVTVQNTGASSPTGNSVVAVLALYLIMAPFFVTLASAIDTTAGERERGTLEPLLVQPVSSLEIIVAKWLALSLLGLVGAALTIALGMWALRAAPLADAGVALDLGTGTLASAVVVVAPLAAFVAALQVWVGLQAKTYKEGQSYLTMVAFLPMALGIAAFKAIPPNLQPIPLLQEVEVLKALLVGQRPQLFTEMTSLWIAVVTVALLFAAASRLRSAALVHG